MNKTKAGIRTAFNKTYTWKKSSGGGCELRPHCLPLGLSTCDFHLRLWLSAQQDIPERVFAWLNINSPSKQPGEGGGGSLWPSPGLRFLLKINQTVHSLGPKKYQHALRGATYSTQQRSAGASPRLNDTCTSPPAASADAAATHRQQAGGN